MKFSLFFEMQISEPTRASEAQMFHDCVDQAVLADELGYHAVWEVEHHGLYEYSHSSAPEVFLAFVAARTRNIRLGHGVTLTPGFYNHPIRIAERVATLDVLSEGRVLWGSGKSSSLVEQGAFQCRIEELHDQWLEALHMIPRMWREDVFEHSGRFYQVPPIQVIPKPVQQPHPPMFAACTKPDSAAGVGRLGLGALNFSVGNDTEIAAKVVAYRQAVAEAETGGWEKTNHFAATPVTLCLKNDREACRQGVRGAAFFTEALATYYFSGTRPLGRLPISREFLSDQDLEAAMAFRGAPEAPAMHVLGDPVHCREIVSRFEAAGVDELLLVMQVGGVSHELIMESIRTFGEEVMPHFANGS